MGLLPKTIGAVDLAEVEPASITLIAPYAGQTKAVSAALKDALGVTFPAPNRAVGTGARAVWCGIGQALLIGANCPDLKGAACIDQSDAWAIVRIDGVDAAAVLARLTPVDLRNSQFKSGHTARTLVGHMTASITRVGAHSFEVMVMRSMAATLAHELEQAAENMAARANA
nr:sarcosine oxidase subunit gamma [Octadecabacter sp. B2R22]